VVHLRRAVGGSWTLLAATGLDERLSGPVWALFTMVSCWTIPAAIGIARLRYRLYGIDRLLNRTLVFGLLTTLAVAALSSPPGAASRRRRSALQPPPLRRRQDLEAFSVHLRDQVDLETLAAELLAVVDQTVQPTRASLWLRPRRVQPAVPPR
jgi:hypothetical protein